jgi:uncharacterized glyoxalase superfamily protein PhnB
MMVNLLDVSAVPELIAPAPVARADAGSRCVLAVLVDDVDDVDDGDAACSELERRGVMLLNGPTDRACGVRTASFTDPAGHIWELARDLD